MRWFSDARRESLVGMIETLDPAVAKPILETTKDLFRALDNAEEEAYEAESFVEKIETQLHRYEESERGLVGHLHDVFRHRGPLCMCEVPMCVEALTFLKFERGD